MLGLILEWLSDAHASRGAGYGYACLLVVAAIGINMLNAHEIKARSRAYLKVRAIVMAAVYRKSLAIRAVGHASGGDGAADASSGQIVNLMSSDADRVGLGVFCNIDPPIAIVYVLVALVLLYQRLGVGACRVVLCAPES